MMIIQQLMILGIVQYSVLIKRLKTIIRESQIKLMKGMTDLNKRKNTGKISATYTHSRVKKFMTNSENNTFQIYKKKANGRCMNENWLFKMNSLRSLDLSMKNLNKEEAIMKSMSSRRRAKNF